ncbi:hypothetical protein GT347_17980 [Xylophilus rhododendri]|uniref:Pentatricopeptide repeat-containing protein n=1 Tax=Xylophilus rhododendri TaxID=2697032 RepID=A0A857J9H1_9BURK|nr:hypothetical protein [Xylophilus rhododendri]QHI99699.1 hypothetical protein GT347_17980 [Xylophilus rhododendri]
MDSAGIHHGPQRRGSPTQPAPPSAQQTTAPETEPPAGVAALSADGHVPAVVPDIVATAAGTPIFQAPAACPPEARSFAHLLPCPVPAGTEPNASIVELFNRGEIGARAVVQQTCACMAKCGTRWQDALACMHALSRCDRRHPHAGVGEIVCPNVVLYTSAIRVCKHAGETARALALFQHLLRHGPGFPAPALPDARAFNVVMAACQEGGWIDMALRLFDELSCIGPLQASPVFPTAVSYAVAAAACAGAQRPDWYVGLLRLGLGLQQDTGRPARPVLRPGLGFDADRNRLDLHQPQVLVDPSQPPGVHPALAYAILHCLRFHPGLVGQQVGIDHGTTYVLGEDTSNALRRTVAEFIRAQGWIPDYPLLPDGRIDRGSLVARLPAADLGMAEVTPDRAGAEAEAEPVQAYAASGPAPDPACMGGPLLQHAASAAWPPPWQQDVDADGAAPLHARSFAHLLARPPRDGDAPNASIIASFNRGEVDAQQVLRVTVCCIKRCGSDWKTALACLHALSACCRQDEHSGEVQAVYPNTIAYTVAIVSCELGRQPAMAMALFEHLRVHGPHFPIPALPDVKCINAAMSACEKSGWTSTVLALLDCLLCTGPRLPCALLATYMSYCIGLRTCASLGRPDWYAPLLWRGMQDHPGRPDGQVFQPSLGFDATGNRLDLRRTAVLTPHHAPATHTRGVDPALALAILHCLRYMPQPLGLPRPIDRNTEIVLGTFCPEGLEQAVKGWIQRQGWTAAYSVNTSGQPNDESRVAPAEQCPSPDRGGAAG